MIALRAIRKTTLRSAFLFAALCGFGQTLYWENPQVFVPQGMGSSSSAVGRSLIALAWQEIRPRSATDRRNGDIHLSLAVSRDGVSWKSHPRFYPPFHYTSVTEGNEPRVYSMTVDSSDRITLAVSVSDRETVILQSVDEGASFQEMQRLSSSVPIGAPNLFLTSGGGFLLMVAQGSTRAEVTTGTGSVTFAYSTSPNGRAWTAFTPFVTPADNLGNPQLQAAHVVMQGRDYVIFQSLTVRSESTATWQLFMKSSQDGGVTWDAAQPVTSRAGPFSDDPLGFNNERPRLAALDGRLALVWERSPFGSDTPRIWSAQLDGKGGLIGGPEPVTADGPARFARVISLRGQEYVLYADGSRGAFRIVLAQKGRTWETQPLLNTDVVNALFPHVVVRDNSLYIFWENQATAGGASSLVQLRPLASVGSPVVKALDFTPGLPANKDVIQVAWSEPQPPDPSGIKEYRYTWSYDDGVKTVEVEKKTVSGLTGTRLFSQRQVNKDGTWKFSIVAQDLAGNISRTPATASFVRDSTPPKPVSFEIADAQGRVLLTAPAGDPEKRDLNGYAVDANTFTLRWVPGGDKDIAGYTFNNQPGWADLAQYRASQVPLLSPPSRVVTTSTDIPFRNSDNGVYAITVRAIDKAGNLSAPSTIALALSHYLPVTRVDFVSADRNPLLGTVTLTIVGRGFTQNGTVRKVYFDRAHREPPWDMEFDPSLPVTVTDRIITGIVLDANRQDGAYRVGLLQERQAGLVLYFTPDAKFNFESPGTVKIGNFQLLLPRWAAGRTPGHALPFDTLVILLVVLLLGTISFLSIRRIFALAQEGAVLQVEVMALISGHANMAWEERKKRMQALKKKGVGLRLKFTLLTVILVTMIVLIVSIPLGYQMVGRQRLALASGLQNNASILLDALAASAESQIRLAENGFLAAGDIPRLRTAMTEANYTTITGPDPSISPTPYPKDFVWASDQAEIAAQKTQLTFKIAKQTVKDDLAKKIVPALQKQIDTDGAKKFSSLIDEYRSLQGQAAELGTKTDALSKTKLKSVREQLGQKSTELDTLAKADYAHFSTLEPFNPAARLSPTYLFYKPIVYYNLAANLTDTTFYQGMVRLEVKTDAITRQINDAIGTILKTAGAIALAAIALGVLGAIVMASITVTPIRKLAQGVAKIRDTEKKEDLKDHTIVVGSRDEIGELADTVNAMTQGLVKAALANNELLAGIDVQKRFLPLMKGAGAVTGSTAEKEDSKVEVYGYYRGAKGVSGDYFDFKELDQSHYALIKCDIAGKGVSAALIMVEVATIFISYFREWETRKKNIALITETKARQRALRELERIDTLVYRINDMLEERGFPGRFAALTICILNTETGVTTVCNAGDTIINVYEAEQNRMVHYPLPDSPAAGTFPSDLVEMKAPYKQVLQKLDHGDALFLQTDGIEESKRKLRSSSFEEMVCDEPGLAVGDTHLGTHKKGDKEGTEEFGTTRIDGILNAMFNRGTYTLVRNHNPLASEELTFDFSSCAGTAREAVLALIAVEKVYRMIPDPRAAEGNRVMVDTKVAAFLEQHFKQYGSYFGHPLKEQALPGYVTFSHAKEDDQYDDLTILVVRRK